MRRVLFFGSLLLSTELRFSPNRGADLSKQEDVIKRQRGVFIPQHLLFFTLGSGKASPSS